MKRYVAFLRAINVGSHTVRMDELKRLFEALDLANVETFIASGNVLFDSSAKPQLLERRIETQLAENLGYEVATFLRSTAEVLAVAKYEPFGWLDDASYASLYVSFVGQPVPADAEARILAYRSEHDDFHVQGREVYWLCRTKMSDSRLTPAKLEKLSAARRRRRATRRRSSGLPQSTVVAPERFGSCRDTRCRLEFKESMMFQLIPFGLLARSMAIRTLMAVVAATSATVVTAGAHSGNPTGSADVASVTALWATLWSAKNLDGVIALYAEDAVFLPSTGTRVEGRAAIRELFTSALAAHDPDITVRSTKSEVVGDFAYDIGEYRETVTINGVATTGRGSYLVVLRRGLSNRWLIVSQMWTDEPAGSHS